MIDFFGPGYDVVDQMGLLLILVTTTSRSRRSISSMHAAVSKGLSTIRRSGAKCSAIGVSTFFVAI
jgi:hypothetical protein